MTLSPTLRIADASQSLREVARLLRPRRLPFAGAVLLLLAGSMAALVIPAALGAVVDAVIASADLANLALWGALIAVAGLASALLLRFGGSLLVSALQGALAELREDVLSAALRIDTGIVEHAGASDVLSRVTSDVEAITAAVSDVVPQFLRALFTIALTMVGLAALDLRLAAAALIAVPIQAITTARFLRRSRPLYRRLRREEAARNQAVIEAVRGAETVAAHLAHRRHLARIAHRSHRAIETGRDAGRARNAFFAGLNLAEFLGLSAVLTVGCWLAVTQGLTAGAVTAAALFFHRLFDPIGALLSGIDDLQSGGAGLGRLVGVLQMREPAPERQPPRGGSITIRGASFSYAADDAPALDALELTLAEGSTTLLVGASGSGKSTLARLIAGVCEPTVGSVHLGGVPARHAGDERRRSAVLVTQELHRFGGSIAENLRLAAPDAADDALRQALATVGASWLDDLPHGLATMVTSELDDARLQHLALARVLLADPLVVVLDEPSAHGGAGHALDAAIAAVVRDRTAVIVAHRFAQAEQADTIVVLEHGRIVEQGTHTMLMREPAGIYRRLRDTARHPNSPR
ncbi:ABC transporter ATP-binding protein [Microbacterium sp. ZW T5_56]|uniref:ABC transporter ATP-binding protein n=1 Tax=Microbacterium sp. ZW T5_56 TaxID=3378081 RepID=UPI00385469BB